MFHATIKDNAIILSKQKDKTRIGVLRSHV